VRRILSEPIVAGVRDEADLEQLTGHLECVVEETV
jgi:hypothetical protein